MSQGTTFVHISRWLLIAACAMVFTACGSHQTGFPSELRAAARAHLDCTIPVSSLPAGSTRVYIALRNGVDGGGQSAVDARDGSDPTAFDTVLRCYEEGCSGVRPTAKTENLIVCLGPGTFQTLGTYDATIDLPHPTPRGFRIGKGWKIHGQGAGETTLQLSDYLPIVDPVNPQHLPSGTGAGLVLSTSDHKASGVEISDLTIDANYPALKQRAVENGIGALNLEAIRLWSGKGGNWIHDVNVINAAGEIGMLGQIWETFTVTAGSALANSSPLDNTGNLIENVTVGAFGGGKAVAININNATGEVRNNRVNGYQIGYGGWSLGPVYFHDNTAIDTTYGFNIDSLVNSGVRIEANRIEIRRGYGLVIGGFGVYDNLSIRGNTIVIEDPQSTGLLFTGNVTHSLIAGNRFVVENSGSGGTAIRNLSNTDLAGPNENNVYQANMIDSRLGTSFEAPSYLLLNCAFGNHDEKGNPRGDLPDTSSAPCVP